jgi:hypothetical protein
VVWQCGQTTCSVVMVGKASPLPAKMRARRAHCKT